MHNELNLSGYCITDKIFNKKKLCDIASELSDIDLAGERRLLQHRWCKHISDELQEIISIQLPELANMQAIQCTYFRKNRNTNWLVSWHQDRSLPFSDDEIPQSAIRMKHGQRFYQPPESILNNVIAVRLSLDGCHTQNGGLKVLPGSHRYGILSESTILDLSKTIDHVVPSIPRGSALIMRPLLLHASSKSVTGNLRRVLHFTYQK